MNADARRAASSKSSTSTTQWSPQAGVRGAASAAAKFTSSSTRSVVEPQRSQAAAAARDAEYVSALHRVHSNTEATEVPLRAILAHAGGTMRRRRAPFRPPSTLDEIGWDVAAFSRG